MRDLRVQNPETREDNERCHHGLKKSMCSACPRQRPKWKPEVVREFYAPVLPAPVPRKTKPSRSGDPSRRSRSGSRLGKDGRKW